MLRTLVCRCGAAHWRRSLAGCVNWRSLSLPPPPLPQHRPQVIPSFLHPRRPHSRTVDELHPRARTCALLGSGVAFRWRMVSRGAGVRCRRQCVERPRVGAWICPLRSVLYNYTMLAA